MGGKVISWPFLLVHLDWNIMKKTRLLPIRNHMKLLCRLSLTVLVVSSSLSAQIVTNDTIMKRFELPADFSPFPSRLQINELYFASASHGYVRHELQDLKKYYYRTRDSGRHWELLDTAYRSGMVMLDSLFGVSPSTGEWTHDAAETWQHVTIPGDGDSTLPLIVIRASQANVIGGLVATPAIQPVWSTDGGVTWQIPNIDTVTIPPGATDLDSITQVRWQQMFYVGDSVIYLIPNISGYLPNGQFRRRDPVCVINPWTGVFDWRPGIPGGGVPQVVNDSVAVTFTDRQSADTMQFWRTNDGGRTWSNRPVPVWIGDVWFFSKDYGVSRNAVTYDGGASWQRWWSVPTESQNTPFQAVDSGLFYVAGPPSYFARTTDGGHSWEQNHPPSGIASTVIQDSMVVMARDLASIAVSHDAGESFLDVGAMGEFPSSLRKVLKLTIPDTTEPGRILGIARLYDYEQGAYLQMIESQDSGLSWRLEERVSSLEEVGDFRFITIPGTEERLGILGYDTTYLLSSDLGQSWELRPPLPFRPIHLTVVTEDFWLAVGAVSSYTESISIWRTQNQGESWETVYTQLPTINLPITIHPVSQNRIIIILADWAQLETRWRIVESSDRGETWSGVLRSDELPEGRSLAKVHWIDTLSFYTFVKSSSNGFDPFSDSLVVYQSIDGGLNIEKPAFMVILPTGNLHAQFPPKDIALGKRYWYMIDQREGLLRIDMQQALLSSPEEIVVRYSPDLQLYPNIIRSGVQGAFLRVEGEKSRHIDVRLYSVLGAEVNVEIGEPVLDKGEDVVIPLRGLDVLAPGYYTVKVRADGSERSVPMIVQ